MFKITGFFVSFEEVIDIKAYIMYYINNMTFLRKLTNMDVNDKNTGTHHP